MPLAARNHDKPTDVFQKVTLPLAGQGASPAPLLAAVCQWKAREPGGRYLSGRQDFAMAMLSGNIYEHLIYP
jgi:hypothetical protein